MNMLKKEKTIRRKKNNNNKKNVITITKRMKYKKNTLVGY